MVEAFHKCAGYRSKATYRSWLNQRISYFGEINTYLHFCVFVYIPDILAGLQYASALKVYGINICTKLLDVLQDT